MSIYLANIIGLIILAEYIDMRQLALVLFGVTINCDTINCDVCRYVCRYVFHVTTGLRATGLRATGLWDYGPRET